MSNSLWPHGLQHARLPCPSPSPEACSNSRPLSQWCHPTISSSVIPFSSCFESFPASFPSIGVFSNESVLHIRWPNMQLQLQHHSFQLIFRIDSFRTDWFDLLTVQGTLKSLLQHHSLKASIQYTRQILLCTRFNAKYKAYNTEQVKHGPCSQGVRGL